VLASSLVLVVAGPIPAESPRAKDMAVPVYTNADLVDGLPEPLARLEWSERPGVFEAGLRRRHGNPLFVDSRREVEEAEVLEARGRDAEQMWIALEDYVDLARDKKRMARYELASEMGEALLRLDENTWGALQTGGEAYALAAATQEIRLSLIDVWRDVATVDPGVKALLDAEERVPAVETDSAAIRFLALVQAEYGDQEGPLRRYEYGAALLSEDVETIEKVHSLLRGELRDSVRRQLASVLEDIGREEIEFEGKREKVTAVAEMLGKNPAAFGVRFQPGASVRR